MGQMNTMRLLMNDRFGDRASSTDLLVQRLAGWPDPAQAVHAITSAAIFEELDDLVSARNSNASD